MCTDLSHQVIVFFFFKYRDTGYCGSYMQLRLHAAVPRLLCVSERSHRRGLSLVVHQRKKQRRLQELEEQQEDLGFW